MIERKRETLEQIRTRLKSHIPDGFELGEPYPYCQPIHPTFVDTSRMPVEAQVAIGRSNVQIAKDLFWKLCDAGFTVDIQEPTIFVRWWRDE